MEEKNIEHVFKKYMEGDHILYGCLHIFKNVKVNYLSFNEDKSLLINLKFSIWRETQPSHKKLSLDLIYKNSFFMGKNYKKYIFRDLIQGNNTGDVPNKSLALPKLEHAEVFNVLDNYLYDFL